MDDLVGKKVTGFRFDDDEYSICFAPEMDRYIGREGEIISVDYEEGLVEIGFDGWSSFYYPLEEVRSNMLPKMENHTNNPTDSVVDDKEDLHVGECDSYGVKDNSKKLPMSKLKVQFPNALQAVVLCSSMGHEKYKDTDKDWLNFTRVPGGSETYRDACERHSLHEVGDVDEESGLPHLFHELWNKMAEVEIWIKENYKEIT